MAMVATATLAACTATPIPAPTSSPTPTPIAPSGDGVLRIGTLFPASGATAFLAPAQVAGVNAAIREINQAGGVKDAPVEVLNRDSGEAATQKAEESLADLVARVTDAVVGPSSSVLAERLLPAAATASIPVVSPAATYPGLEKAAGGEWFFRTIPAYSRQAGALAAEFEKTDAASVVLVAAADDVSASLAAPLEKSVTAAGGTLAVVDLGADAAATATAALADSPDAVVLATPDNGAATLATITALRTAGLAPEKLWLTSQNLADYSQALPAGLLAGAHGVLEGAAPDDAFRAKVKQEDPGVGDIRYAAEAYDATVLIALAAQEAGDDGGASIAAHLRAVSTGGIKCTSYGECLSALADGQDIDYDGVSGPVNLGASGGPGAAQYGTFSYGADNRYVFAEAVVG